MPSAHQMGCEPTPFWFEGREMWSCLRISLRTTHGVVRILSGEGNWDELTTVNPHGDNLAVVFSDDALP
jgi:hypothetical protein